LPLQQTSESAQQVLRTGLQHLSVLLLQQAVPHAVKPELHAASAALGIPMTEKKAPAIM